MRRYTQRLGDRTQEASMKLVPLVLATGAAAVLASTGTAAAVGAPSCNLASAKLVKSALGLTVASPSVTKNGPVTVCLFTSTPPLIVRFETNENPSLFALGRKGFGQHGQPTKTVNGLGSQAYSSSIGSTSNTIVVLENKTELLITGDEPLAKLVALAKLILPSL
jgi:hypothetical protein